MMKLFHRAIGEWLIPAMAIVETINQIPNMIFIPLTPAFEVTGFVEGFEEISFIRPTFPLLPLTRTRRLRGNLARPLKIRLFV
jgi:hypothetical protein